MAIPVMKLCTMSEADLNKMTKSELVASIKHESFYPNHYKSEAEKLQKQAQENATSERASSLRYASCACWCTAGAKRIQWPDRKPEAKHS